MHSIEGETVNNPQDYVRRAEECCANFSDARSAAEKQAWLTIAESWLILARNKCDLPLQGLAQSVVESGRETRASERRFIPELTTETAQEVTPTAVAEGGPQTFPASGADLPIPLSVRANSLRSWTTRPDAPDASTLRATSKFHPA
jgi:hypothetical protein